MEAGLGSFTNSHILRYSHSHILTFSFITQRYAYYIDVVHHLTIRKHGIVYDFIFIKRSEIMRRAMDLACPETSKLL
jgi:hypothetical protein